MLKLSRYLILIALAIILLSCTQSVKYEVKNCIRGYSKVGYVYDGKNLYAYVLTNCCSDEIKVVRIGNTYKILEKDNDGKICRCVCVREVVIYNVPKDFNVTFVDLSGKVHKLKEIKFCGISTYGKCRSDFDCVVTGCSHQVCAAKGQKIFTTCEWKECYNAKLYHMTCRCVSGHCQWTPQN